MWCIQCRPTNAMVEIQSPIDFLKLHYWLEKLLYNINIPKSLITLHLYFRSIHGKGDGYRHHKRDADIS